ncbi:unnamed protein product [Merluccius merluccius]
MAESRVIPSGRLYRQMFDAQDLKERSRSTCEDLLSSLEEMDERLDSLMDRMECQQLVSLQIVVLLRKYCTLLERISFLDPCDVYRLLDTEAMEALCTLELSEEEVKHILNSQILSLIGPCQRQAEDRLAILDKKEAHLDVLLDRLRQESSEEALKSSLERVLVYLDDITNRKYPISTQNELDHTQALQDGLLTEAELSFAEIYTPDTKVTFTSKRGGAYSGPSFNVPALDPLGSLGDEVQLILFPTEMLTQTLTQ